MAIIIKTVNEIANLDAINGRDAFAFLVLKGFDFVRNRIQVDLEKEVLINGGPETSKETMLNITRGVPETTMDNLWTQYGNDLLSTENWTSEIRAYMVALLKKYAQNEGWFGLNASDWEIVTP